jgi:YVTN family beta-propeller protein
MSIFVGRERELAALTAGLDDAFAGHGRLFLISGEPGIGKTRLAEELAACARERGADVLVGRCWEAGGAPAFWPWVQVLRARARDRDREQLGAELAAGAPDIAEIVPELRQLFPDLPHPPALDSDGARFRLFDSVSLFLRATAEANPLVVVLDDLHAADEPSLLLLRFLARELEQSRLLIVAAYRDVDPTLSDPLSTAVIELAREPITRTLVLTGLDRPAVAQFIELTTDRAPAAELSAAVHAETDGNPLFVEEIVRLLAAEGRLDDAAAPRLAIPHSVTEVIRRRLRQLPEDCTRVLAHASVLGREFDVDTLTRTTGLQLDHVLPLLDEAKEARLVADIPGTAGRFRFAHVLIRDALYESLPPSRRAELHHEAGEALETQHAHDLDPHLAELAHHFLRAEVADRSKALDYSRRAGERAAGLLAHEEAVRFYEIALTLTDDTDVRCELLLALGEAQSRAGDTPAAKAVFREAAEIAEAQGLPDQLAQAALGYGGRVIWDASRDDPQLGALLERALRALGDEDSILRVRVLARLAAGPLRDSTADADRRHALAAEALEVARRLGDPWTLAHAMLGYISSRHSPAFTHQVPQYAREITQVALQAGDLECAIEGYASLFEASIEIADLPAAQAHVEAMTRLAEDLRQPAQRWVAALYRSFLALLEGRFGEAERLIPETHKLGERAQTWTAGATYALQLYLLRREQGRLSEVEALLRRASAESRTYPILRCALANMLGELGSTREARFEFEALAAEDFAQIPFDEEWAVSVCLLAETSARLGDRDRAATLYELLAPYADRVTISYTEISLGPVARYLGILAEAIGRDDDAERHFRDSLELSERIGARPWLAHSQHDLARLLLARRQPGDAEDAAELLRSALATSRELGMEPLAARVAALLAGLEPADVGADAAFGGYRIEAEIGRGGMGVVYRAIDMRLDRPVALKLVAPELAEDRQFRERFLRESRLAAAIDHGNVLPIYEAGEQEGQLFLAMRFVQGSDLKALLRERKTLPADEALSILGRVADALDAAHAKGLVHRDVKPANVLLDERGHPYLGDFGLTKEAGDASTQTGQMVGTLDYLAPEQIRGEALDGRSDQYALACVLYQCLAGEPPFHRRTEAETLWAHMQERPPALREYPALDPVLAKGLAKDKDERYRSCGEFLAAAHSALGLEAPAARRRRLRVGRRLLLAGAALVAAAGIAVAVVELTGGGSSAIASVPPNSLVSIDPETNRIASSTAVGAGPVAVAVGEGSVWVANAADQTVSRIDPRTKQLVRTIGTGRTPSAIAIGDGSVWVANAIGARGTVSRIEPQSDEIVRTTVARPRLQPDPFAPPTPSTIAVGSGSAWTNGNPRAFLARFSTRTGAVRRPALLGQTRSVDGIALGEDAVWVSSSADDTVLRVDPATSRVTAAVRIAAAGERVAGPYGIAVGGGSVWVADSLANAVSRIDPRLRAVTATIPVGLRPTNVAVGEHAVWVLNRGDGTVSRIDPETNIVSRVLRVGAHPTGLAIGAGAVWVTVAGGSAAPTQVAAPELAKALPASSCSNVVRAGAAQPHFLIASDLPHLAGGRPSVVTSQMNQAIRLVLEQHDFRAGAYTVGFQACDDSSKAAGDADPARCVANARAFANDSSLLALIGSYNSFCSGLELPITNASPPGPLATISPSNTYVGLTTSGPATSVLEPDQYYPTGVRSFVRLPGNDQAQGAADALLARGLGLRRIYLLDDGSGTAVADATYTGRTLARLGRSVVGWATWHAPDTEFSALAHRVARARPDGVYVAGWEHAVELIRDLKATLGRRVTFFAPDNIVNADTFYGKPPTTGLYITSYGQPLGRLGTAGRRFLAAFRARYGRPVLAADVVAAAQAAEIALRVIARSHGTRASVVNELHRIRVVSGELGSFGFDRNGDPTRSPFTIWRFPPRRPTHKPPYATLAEQGGVVDRVLLAEPRLADAPRS